MAITRIVMKSKVGSDGVLHLTLPRGTADVGQGVQVTIDPVMPTPTQEEWRRQVLATAGVWQGECERPDLGESQERDSLS